MAQRFSNQQHVTCSLVEPCGVAVTQRVRRGAAVDPGFAEPVVEASLNVARRAAFPAATGDERPRGPVPEESPNLAAAGPRARGPALTRSPGDHRSPAFDRARRVTHGPARGVSDPAVGARRGARRSPRGRLPAQRVPAGIGAAGDRFAESRRRRRHPQATSKPSAILSVSLRSAAGSSCKSPSMVASRTP